MHAQVESRPEPAGCGRCTLSGIRLPVPRRLLARAFSLLFRRAPTRGYQTARRPRTRLPRRVPRSRRCHCCPGPDPSRFRAAERAREAHLAAARNRVEPAVNDPVSRGLPPESVSGTLRSEIRRASRVSRLTRLTRQGTMRPCQHTSSAVEVVGTARKLGARRRRRELAAGVAPPLAGARRSAQAVGAARARSAPREREQLARVALGLSSTMQAVALARARRELSTVAVARATRGSVSRPKVSPSRTRPRPTRSPRARSRTPCARHMAPFRNPRHGSRPHAIAIARPAAGPGQRRRSVAWKGPANPARRRTPLIAQSADRAAVIDQRAVPMQDQRQPMRRVAPRLVGLAAPERAELLATGPRSRVPISSKSIPFNVGSQARGPASGSEWVGRSARRCARGSSRRAAERRAPVFGSAVRDEAAQRDRSGLGDALAVGAVGRDRVSERGFGAARADEPADL